MSLNSKLHRHTSSKSVGTVRGWLVGFFLAITALIAGAQEPPRGELLTREHEGQIYYLYIAKSFALGGATLVAVHGASRGAEAHGRAWMEIAEREKLVVVAPLFDQAKFPDYQRLNFRGPRADLVLHAILEEVRQLTGADVRRFYLYGFSGGGQFAHRYALAHPDRIRRVVVGAPGWWTLPETKFDYPRGIRKTSAVPPDVEFRLDELLRLPLAVVVGEKDTQRDRALRQDGDTDRPQGQNRLARARYWVAQMRRLAEEKQMAHRFELYVVGGVGHSGTHPHIIRQAAAFLFPRPQRESQN